MSGPATPGQGHDHGQGHRHEAGLDSDRGPSADASVGKAGLNDLPALGIVQAAVWQEAYDGIVPPEVHAAFQPAAFAAGWRESVSNPPPGVYELLVARAGGQVVGFAAIAPSQDPDAGQTTGEIIALGVHPHGRRQGHGSRLVNACVDRLREAGAEHVAAWVLVPHEQTRAFLAAAGLTPDGAYRDRVVSPDGATAREARLVAHIGAAPDTPAPQSPGAPPSAGPSPRSDSPPSPE
ncbi:N-acetyltransferase family protein [Janibacter sp. GXQ6167]|uniref:GNAT family N-acetyltransferase n=1 Tax=Janibacter sp. GXQ6167 TaxID=3240791 RepID=UPI00352559EA